MDKETFEQKLQEFNSKIDSCIEYIELFENIDIDIDIPLENLQNLKNRCVDILNKDISHHFYQQIISTITNVIQAYPYDKTPYTLPYQTPLNQRRSVSGVYDTPPDMSDFNTRYQNMEVTLNFFDQLGYGNSHIAIIGANGSGKTYLTTQLKTLPNNTDCCVIPAQRMLLLPTSGDFSRLQYSEENLKADKTSKSPSAEYVWLRDTDYAILMKKLIESHITYSTQKEENSSYSDTSLLQKTQEIWHEFLPKSKLVYNHKDRVLEVFNIENEQTYPIHQLSEGEKVILYLTLQVLYAPLDKFIIIDEPEIYIHKSILSKIWDRLEQERPDCLFIYLTHDIDFVVSRNFTKVLWIRKYQHPSEWTIEPVVSEDLPKELLYNLVGSRSPVLFCEGEPDSIDRKIYTILFPEYTVTPVEGCHNVINYTKAFNLIPNLSQKAIGIVDRDHRPEEQITALRQDKIYPLNLSEIENVLLTPDFLNILLEKWYESATLESIKDIIFPIFNQCIDILTSEFVRDYLRFKFENNIIIGNSKENIQTSLNKFYSEINIDTLYNDRKRELELICTDKDYNLLIKNWNRKDLHKKIKVQNYQERAMKFLKDKNNQNHLTSLRSLIVDIPSE